MIRVILKGGLGNQMFQYALGKSLSLKYKVPLVLDLSFLRFRLPFKELTPYKGFTYRTYSLDVFEVEETPVKGTYYPILHVFNKLIYKNYHKEGDDPYYFDESVFNIGDNIVLDGYWNNYRYFKKYKEDIKFIFKIDKLYEKNTLDFEERIRNTNNSVAVHVRRGDYLNNKHKSVYIRLDNYYKKAITFIKDKLKNPYFFLFSDNPSMVNGKDHSLRDGEFEIMPEEISGYQGKAHFRLMSLCNNNIISNSTYSWWSAYLNENKNKIVVAPHKWMYAYDFENIESWKIMKE